MQKVVQQLPGASYFKRGDRALRNLEEEDKFLTQLESCVKDFENRKLLDNPSYEQKKLE